MTRLTPWTKMPVTWQRNGTLYISCVFTWQLEAARKLAEAHDGPVVCGGPAFVLKPPDWAPEVQLHCDEDVLAMHNPEATFTTRGCPNQCSFCAVPRLEGRFYELPNWKIAPIVCDNNILASSRRHFEAVISSLQHLPCVDFNQGMSARLLTPWHAEQLRRLKHVRARFAFDNMAAESAVMGAIALCRRVGIKDVQCYVLLGYHDTPDDALYRLEALRKVGVWPNPMRYQPLDADKKNDYVAPGWTKEQLANMMRYYSCLRWLDNVPFKDYDRRTYERQRRQQRRQTA